MSQVFFLMGPTAVGKTGLALELAERFPIDVISVDASQVYRSMDIGTAKPSAEVLKRVPHQLIDVCDPWDRYSAGRFCRDARFQIDSSLQQNRIPFLVGGTMFYFRALEEGLSNLPPASTSYSQQLQDRAQIEGWSRLHAELMKIDPFSASKISPNDSQRIQRLLDLHQTVGQPPSETMLKNKMQPLPYIVRKIAFVDSYRNCLRIKISNRFREMLDQGFIEEAENLYKSSWFDVSLPAMRSVGYRQAWKYLSGEINYSEMASSAIQATSQMAKRQLTWLRNSTNVTWLTSKSENPTKQAAAWINCCLNNHHAN